MGLGEYDVHTHQGLGRCRVEVVRSPAADTGEKKCFLSAAAMATWLAGGGGEESAAEALQRVELDLKALAQASSSLLQGEGSGEGVTFETAMGVLMALMPGEMMRGEVAVVMQ